MSSWCVCCFKQIFTLCKCVRACRIVNAKIKEVSFQFLQIKAPFQSDLYIFHKFEQIIFGCVQTTMLFYLSEFLIKVFFSLFMIWALLFSIHSYNYKVFSLHRLLCLFRTVFCLQYWKYPFLCFGVCPIEIHSNDNVTVFFRS